MRKKHIDWIFEYREAGKIQQIRKYGQLESEEYLENGIEVKAWIPERLYHQLREENGDETIQE